METGNTDEDLTTSRGVRRHLVAQLATNLEWRQSRAQRDAGAGDTEAVLATQRALHEVGALSDEDTRLTAIARFYAGFSAPWAFAEDDCLETYIDEQERLIRRHGGDDEGTTRTTDELLGSIVAVALDAERCCQDASEG
jgi:hypothetical protein